MGILDNLFQGTPATSNQSGTRQYPDWYQDYTRNLGAASANAAANPYPQYTKPRVAGWSQDQITARDRQLSNNGAWDAGPAAGVQAYAGLPGQVAPVYQASGQAIEGALGAAGGPSRNWTDEADKYMSPYTKQVVDNIARLGQRNMSEKLLPAVNDAFIGAGGFGSTRNAEILGRTMRDVNADILGQQASALEAGYGASAGIFNQDANRSLQQQQLGAQTGIQAANAGANLASNWASNIDTAGRGMGALSQVGQGLQRQDTQDTLAMGNQQQGQMQKIYDTDYQDFQNYNNWDWNQLNNASGVLSKLQVPTFDTATGTNTAAQPSGLGWMNYLAGLQNGTPTNGPAPKG